MGQHRRDIQRIYQRPEKNSQSAFRQNPHDALQTQGSGLAMSKLWDGSEEKSQKMRSSIISKSAKSVVKMIRRYFDFGFRV
jgi:hypothetical protein